MQSVSTNPVSGLCNELRFNFQSSIIKPLAALASVVLLVAGLSTPAYAEIIEATPGVPSCIVDQPEYKFNEVGCTANDLGLSDPLVTITEACDFPGDTATLQVITNITSTSQTRYDVGFWISVDGDPNNDGSSSGECTVINLDNSIQDTNGTSINIDGNSCGDVQDTGNEFDILGADLGTFSLPCIDDDGDGFIDVPVIVAYKQSEGSCTGPLTALPPTKSKCQENLNTRFQVPVPGRIIVNKTTLPASTQSFIFALTGPALDPVPVGGFDGIETFPLADGQQFDSSQYTSGLTPGQYRLQETPDPDYQSTFTCTSDVDGPVTDPEAMDLGAGETITCNVVNTKKGTLAVIKRTLQKPREITDTVEFQFTIEDLSNGQGPVPFSLFAQDDSSGLGFASIDLALQNSGQFVITELDKASWDLTGLSCAGGSPAYSGNAVTITAAAGDTITCEFENTERGEIRILKETDPTSTDLFNFTHTVTDDTDNTIPPSPFPLAAGSRQDFLNVVPGSYDVIEVVPTALGYELFGIECIDGNPAGTPSESFVDTLTAQINLDPGELVVCNFVNNKFGKLTIEKQLDALGPPILPFAFDADILGQFDLTPTGVGPLEFESIVFDNISPDVYTVTEDDPTANGWELASATCDTVPVTNLLDPNADPLSSVTVAPGADVTCTFINTPLTAQVTLQKAWVGAATGDTATLTATGLNGPVTAISTATGVDQIDITNTAVLTARVGETITLSEVLGGTGAYSSSFNCTGGANAPVYTAGDTSATLEIGLADTAITCTYTNTQLGKLTVLKQVDALGPPNLTFGFDAGILGQFDLTPTGVGPLEFESIVFDNIASGDYPITEDDPAANGWELASATCDTVPETNLLAAGSVFIAPGADVTCTFTNTPLTAQVTLQKAWVGGVTGDTATLTATGLNGPVTAISTATGVDQIDTTNTAVLTARAGETITLSEVLGGTGTYIPSFNCTGGANAPTYTAGDTSATLEIGLADTAITCTFTNSKPSIELLKVGTLNDDDGTAGVSAGDTISYAFTVTNTGGVTLTGITLADTVGGVTITGGPIATLAPAGVDSTTFTGSYAITQADIDAGTFTNTATVTGTAPDASSVTDTDDDTQPLAAMPSLTLVKTATPTTYSVVGDVISYSYLLTNSGNLTLYPTYAVSDDKVTVTCPATPASLAPTESVTCTASYTIEQTDLDAGTVVNMATGTAQDAATGGAPVTSNEDTATVTANVIVINGLAEACINNAPFVTYSVNTSEGNATTTDITWIKDDGSDEVVETILDAPIKGELLWPGASVVNGVAVAWPGWSCDANGENCTKIDDGLTPTMQIRFDINPTDTVIVDYPPATSGCAPVEAPPETIPVPANNPVALLLLTLMLLGSGWYFRPATMRRRKF